MVLRRPSDAPTPLSSGWTTSAFPAGLPTSPKPTNTAAAHRNVTYVDIQALITNNCSLLHPGRLTLVTSHRDNTWTAHITRGPRILLSASGRHLNGALDALHRKSAEAIASRLVAGPPPLNYAEMDSYPEDGEDGEEDKEEEDKDEAGERRGEGHEEEEEEEEEYEPFCGPTPEPYPCHGYGPRPRTRLLPVRRPAPRQRVAPPPPPRTAPPFPPPGDAVPPPPRPPTSPRPPPAVLRRAAAP